MNVFLRRILLTLAVGIFLSCASSGPVDGQSPTPAPAPTPAAFETPLTVFVSDLHFGFGRSGGRWNPLDDFRWSNALKGFLSAISSQTNDQTTLVITGDFFEMWQHPGIRCDKGDADHGCTVAEIEEIARKIVAGHRADLQALGAFAARGGNRLVVIPGNHDAALLLPSVWAIVEPVIAAPTGKLERITSGVWISRNGEIVAEHGHQMPDEDVNGWKRWPRITETFRGREFMIRPWGERFVHGLYNRVEEQYTLIDNLIPQSNGVRHYLKDRGFFGSAGDVARFLAFNLTQTSLTQLGALGEPEHEGPPPWDETKARERGWLLFARALPKDDWYRKKLEEGGAEWSTVKRDLDSLARDPSLVTDDEVKSLCDRAAVITQDETELCPRRDPTLGREILKGLARGARLRALQAHLKARKSTVAPNMRIFVYGHTHDLQCANDVTPEGFVPITVANTGAFQRLADDDKFTKKADEMHIAPARALSQLSLDDLPPCYTAVLVTYRDGDPVVSVKNWLMSETSPQGEFVDPRDCRCAKLGSACQSTVPCN
jgi:hypothetical protein